LNQILAFCFSVITVFSGTERHARYWAGALMLFFL
jgi:hypothetical protein